MDKEAWYRDGYGSNMHGKSGKKEKYAAPESLYNPDGEHSVMTIHERHDSRYADSSGGPIINLSNKFDPTERKLINVVTKNDDMSATTNLSQLSMEELIECLKKLQNSKTSRDSDFASESVSKSTPPPC